jgi:hypothetical protein
MQRERAIEIPDWMWDQAAERYLQDLLARWWKEEVQNKSDESETPPAQSD